MAELPERIRRLFEGFGYGCLAGDSDINALANKPVPYQGQIVEMPTAPLTRLD